MCGFFFAAYFGTTVFITRVPASNCAFGLSHRPDCFYSGFFPVINPFYKIPLISAAFFIHWTQNELVGFVKIKLSF